MSNFATFQNVEGGGTQTYKIVIDDNGNISATANKSISGGKTAKVPKLTWNGQKWVGNGTGANKFLKNAKNLKNLNDRTEELINYNNITNANFPEKKDNTSKGGEQSELVSQPSLVDIVSEATKNADIPKDPEGFFIARYPINQKDTSNFDFLKITCYDYEPGDFGKDTKAAYAFKKDNSAASVNGSAVATDTSGNMPSDINSLMIGRAVWGTSWFDGYVKRVIYYPKRLPNSQLITLTS